MSKICVGEQITSRKVLLVQSKLLKIETDMKKKKLRRRDALERALGAAQRKQYLSENPHGYSRSKSVHKDKNQYSRKQKHKKKDHSDKSSGGSFLVERRGYLISNTCSVIG